MRTIKFRAWDKTLNHGFWYWSAGDTDFDLSKELEKGEMPINQFTGLHDKNRKEIYQGDVVDNQIITGTIIWKDCEFNVKWKERGYQRRLSAWNTNDFEVIGNIYENPELLTPESK